MEQGHRGRTPLKRRRRVGLRCATLIALLLALLSVGLIFATRPLAANAQQVAQAPTPLPLYALPDARSNRVFSSNTMALANEGRVLVAANMLNDTVSAISPGQGAVLAEIPVGADPRSVATTPDNTRALVANRGDGTLSVVDLIEQEVVATIPVGVLPYAVVTDNNAEAYVSLQGSDEIVAVDLHNGRVSQRIAVPDSPAGLALWGDFLYVTHFWSGELSLVYLPAARVAMTVDTGKDTGLSQGIAIDVTRGLAYLPQTRSNAQNPYLTYDTIVFPVVNVLDLRGMVLHRSERIGVDSAGRPVNMPFAVAVDPFRRWLYVANAGSDDVAIIDLDTGLERAHLEVGANPRGIMLNRDNTLLYVHNALDGTITFVETGRQRVIDVLPISNLNVPVDVLIGAELFHSAADPRLSADHWVSCATCHFDGQSDGRTWAGFDGGPRNTPLLYNLLETAPYNWSGSWDELADVELKIRDLQAGEGLIDGPVSPVRGTAHAGLSLDLDTLVSYLTTLQAPTNPNHFDESAVARGASIFAQQDCAQCHVGDSGTDYQRYDVGTGGDFDTPSLRWLWMSAPYFHDGSAATLDDVFALPGSHHLIGAVPSEDIEALVSYLLSLPQG